MGYLRITIFSILLVGTFGSCSVSKDQKQLGEKSFTNNDMELVSAELKKWEGGLKGSEGREVNLVFVGKRVEEVYCDSVWFDEKAGFRANYYTKNDTLFIKGAHSEAQKVKIHDIDAGTTKDAKKVIYPPINYNGDALVRFSISGEQKYYVVKELKRN